MRRSFFIRCRVLGVVDKNDGDGDQAEEDSDIFLRRLETAMFDHVTLRGVENIQRHQGVGAGNGRS